MKKSLLLGITWVTLIALTVTTLYAQVAGSTSIVDKMKAAARASFSLSADLNPGQTGFDSAPVAGKKTGNMLTAAEWNRMLELISEGGGAGGIGWVDVSSTDTTDFDTSCQYRVKLDFIVNDPNRAWSNATSAFIYPARLSTKFFGATYDPPVFFGFQSNNKTTYWYKSDTGVFTTSTNVQILTVQKFCGGGGSSGTWWGDKFTFLDAEIPLVNSWTTTASKGVTTLDISTIPGVVIPAGAKAIQVYVQCNNYTAQNQATSLSLGKSATSLFLVCHVNSAGSSNDVDSNSMIIPLAPDGKSIVYKYDVPSWDLGWYAGASLRGFITQ